MARHTLSRRDARRLAVRAQWLHADRSTGLLELVRHITLLQIDLTAAVAPSAHLVAWSRLGRSYEREELDRARKERALVELRATVRPAEDLALYRADMAAWPGSGELRRWRKSRRDWVEANDACRRDILSRLSTSGPLPSRELPDTCEVPWRSTGWTNNRNVTHLLEFLVGRGEVAVAGRIGNERLWDLAEASLVPAGRSARSSRDIDASPSMVDDVDREIQDLAAWLRLTVVRVSSEGS